MHRLIISYRCANPMCDKVHALAIDTDDPPEKRSTPIDLTHPETLSDLANVLELEGIKPEQVIAMHTIPVPEALSQALEAYADTRKLILPRSPLTLS